MANQSAPGGGGVERNSSGVKHFVKGVKKNLGGFKPPLTPPKNPPISHRAFRQNVELC